MKGRSILSFAVGLTILATSSLALAQRVMTWRSFKTFVQREQAEELSTLIPRNFPNGFAQGQVAITRIHTGSTAYVVAREGSRFSNLSTVRQQIGNSSLFNSADAYSKLANLPALPDFPQTLYHSGRLVEVIHFAARYDGEITRREARQSRQTRLLDGRRAYYFIQDTERQGWCVFGDESVEYSDFICVNVVNSPATALQILQSIVQ